MHSATAAHRARHFGHYLAHAFEKLHHHKHDSDEHSKSVRKFMVVKFRKSEMIKSARLDEFQFRQKTNEFEQRNNF